MSLDPLPRPPVKPDWTLTSQAFNRLLTTLDEDRDRAALAYEQLRQRLIGLLRWWGATDADALADATLDRVARKLEDGAVVAADALGAYVRGVARMVFYESARRARRASAGLDATVISSTNDAEPALHVLDECLASLSDDDRRLVLRYYGSGKAADVRRQLADQLGISPTALRIRAHRLRQQLERRVAASLLRQ